MEEEDIERGECRPPTRKVFFCNFVGLQWSGGVSGWHVWLSSARWLGTAWFKSNKIPNTFINSKCFTSFFKALSVEKQRCPVLDLFHRWGLEQWGEKFWVKQARSYVSQIAQSQQSRSKKKNAKKRKKKRKETKQKKKKACPVREKRWSSWKCWINATCHCWSANAMAHLVALPESPTVMFTTSKRPWPTMRYPPLKSEPC